MSIDKKLLNSYKSGKKKQKALSYALSPKSCNKRKLIYKYIVKNNLLAYELQEEKPKIKKIKILRQRSLAKVS